VLDTAQQGAATSVLLLAAGLFILFGIGQAGLNLAANYVGETVSWQATNALRANLALHVLRLDMGFHNRRTPGELIERVDGDVSELATFFSQLTLKVLANLLLIVGVIVVLYREDWRMGGAATLYALLTFTLLQAVQKRNVWLWSRAREGNAGLYGFIEERLAGLEDTRANGGAGYVLRRLAQLQRATYVAHYAARMFGVFTFSVTHMLFVLASVLGLGLGIWLYQRGQISLGTVYLITYYLTLLREPLEQMRDQVEELQHATASINRVQEFFALQPAVSAPVETGKAITTRIKGPMAVEFTNVSFGYTNNTLNSRQNGEQADSTAADSEAHSVLRYLSFHLAPGKVLGLLGRTGSGKTTITRLLFRLYEPNQGSIFLGGCELKTLSLSELRRSVGMVTQEVQLFQASLRDNMTLFDPTIPDDQILQVLRELGLWAWYSSQPAGLDTLLQAGGTGLSAGEAQLLAFVRVFLKDPGLVILDEASSRLDPATEQLLERAIDRLLQGRTAIIIAHRLATVQRADEILILEAGRVVEAGPRARLAADPQTRFHRLLQSGLQEELA
jgi:ATP-binding cassette, subfamily B, bacterial